MERSLRLFVGIRLPDDLRRDVGRLLGRLRREGVRGGLVPEANLHLSLQFLGDVTESAVPSLVAGYEDICRRVPPFELSMGGVEQFGTAGSPRVVWLATSEPDSLVMLAGEIRRVSEACGITVDERPFKAHITLARIRHARQRGPMRRALEAVRLPAFSGFPVSQFELLQSELTSQGAVYSTQAAFSLQG